MRVKMGSKEYREKMRQIALEKGYGKWMTGKKDSEETRKKKSNSLSGEKNPFYHKKHSNESKKKMSNSLKDKPSSFKGHRHTPESIAKIKAKRALQSSESLKHILSDEQKKLISKRTSDVMSSDKMRKHMSNATKLFFETHPEAKDNLREKRLLQTFSKISSIEVIVKKVLDSLGIENVQQYAIRDKGFLTFVDIYIPSQNLCIYCDGDYWHNRKDTIIRDSYVNTKLEQLGYKLLRFWEHEIHDSIDNCINKITTLTI